MAGLSAFGVAGGWATSRVRSRWWLAGHVLPLALVLTIAAARNSAHLELVAPFRWLMAGRIEFVLLSGLPFGTPTDSLVAAISSRYRPEGVSAEYRAYDSLDDLRRRLPAIAVVRYSFLVDHYVAVLQVGRSGVVVGDPLTGLSTLSLPEFVGKWRKLGVAVRRSGKAPGPGAARGPGGHAARPYTRRVVGHTEVSVARGPGGHAARPYMRSTVDLTPDIGG